MMKKLSKILNRSTKRSARKTVGVLTLIMAIVVAAIPAPHSKADPSSGSGSGAGAGARSVAPPPAYPTGSMDTAAAADPLSPSGTQYQARTIFKFENNGNDVYEMWNVFNFYQTDPSTIIGTGTTPAASPVPGGQAAVISGYNRIFEPQNDRTLTVPHNLVLNYPAFTKAEIDAFFDSSDTDKGGRALSTEDLKHYFPTEMAQYEREKADYDRLTDEQRTQQGKTDPAGRFYKYFGHEDNSPVKASELNAEQRRNYFCKYYDGTGAKDLDAIQGDYSYTLVEVSDKTSTGTSGMPGTTVVYIPFNKSKVTGNDAATGFYVNTENKFSVLAIGDGVFEDVTNIKKLIIENGVVRIGNRAFAGSSIENIQTNAQIIGNRAFKGCTALRIVELGTEGLNIVGVECFEGCLNLNTIEFPKTIQKIGDGAFANCGALANVDMSKTTPNLEIGDYAFYDCTRLNDVKFAASTGKIGDSAFAVAASSTGWTEVKLPDTITQLGKYVLANRNSLRRVTMPDKLGNGNDVELGVGFFYGCSNLECVTFPENCGQVTFTPDAFESVMNPDFIIRGPEFDSRRNTAGPRKSAWEAGITYVYKDHQGTGMEHWETASGIYRYQIDASGILMSCVLLEGTDKINQFKDPAGNDGKVVVPAKVGQTMVTGIGPECFAEKTDKNIYDNMKTLQIEDGSNIKSIDAKAFKGFPKLETVYIGDSVNEIGDEAFKDCKLLKTVVFSKPRGGYGGFKIGKDAFATGGEELTFYGDIVPDYAPFAWAMDKTPHDGDPLLFGNYMNELQQMRICYRSGTPEYPNLTVILDNETKNVTLIDYPHYEDLLPSTRAKYEEYLTGVYDPAAVALDANEARCLNNTLNIVIPDGVESIDVSSYLRANSNSKNIAKYMPMDNYATYRDYGLFNGFYGKDAAGQHVNREYPENDPLEKVDKGNDRILTVTMGTVKFLPDRAFESCENLESVVLGSAMEDIGTAPFTGCTSLTSMGGNGKYSCENGIIYEKNDTGLTIVEALSTRGGMVGSPSVNDSADPKLSNVTQIVDGAFENCASIMNVDLTSAEKLTTIPKNCFHGAKSLMSVLLPESVNDIREEAFSDTRYLSVTIPATEVDIADDAFRNAENVILNSYKGSAIENYAKRKGYTFVPIDKKYRVQFLDYDGTVLPVKNENGDSLSVQYVTEGRAAKEPDEPTRTDGYIFDKWDKSFTNVTSDMVIVAKYKWDSAKYPNTTPGTVPASSPTPGPGTPGAGTPGAGTPGAGTPGAGTPGAGTPGAGTPGASTPGADSSSNRYNQKYRLTVDNGSGDGSYYPGTSVVITADRAPSGQHFDKWTSIANDFNITSATSSITTITMPAHDMTIVANYTSNSSAPGGTGGGGTSGNNAANNTPTPTPLPNGGNVRPGVTVDISKPGISNGNVASAIVQGSTDNYVIKISDTAEARAAVEAALINEYGSLTGLRYFAMDISLYDETGVNKIQDTSNLEITITMPIPDELRQYAGNNQVAAVVNGSALDKYSPRFTTIGGVPCISFKATHFSPYTIYVNTSQLSGSVIDDTPKTGDPIHPKWFLSIGLACISLILLLKKDKKQIKTA